MSVELILKHCSPTLAGLKVGSLFSYKFEDEEEMQSDIEKYNELLNGKGIFFLVLQKTADRALIYVYRKNNLKNILADHEIMKFLMEYNYKEFQVEEALSLLIHHLNHCEKGVFPHEIGVFIGYPLEDIKLFIKHKGSHYKCVGCWKVYNNVEAALKVFTKYSKCKEIYCKKYKEGVCIKKLTVAA